MSFGLRVGGGNSEEVVVIIFIIFVTVIALFVKRQGVLFSFVVVFLPQVKDKRVFEFAFAVDIRVHL